MTSPQDWAAWKNYIYTASHILASAETYLQSAHKLSLSDFDVLVSLYEAPEHTLSMTNLKQSVLVTTSGLSRSVSRLADRGFLTKETAADDKRQITLKLTAEGLEAFHRTAPEHRRHVRYLFFDGLSQKDLRALETALGHLRDHLTH